LSCKCIEDFNSSYPLGFLFCRNQMRLWFIAVMSGFFFLYWLGNKYTIFNPAVSVFDEISSCFK